MFEQLINHFFKYEFVYIFVFITLSFLLLSVILKKQTLKIIFIFMSSIFFSLFSIEFLLSLKMTPLNNKSQKTYGISFLYENIDYSKLERKKRLRYNKNGKQYQYWNTDFIKQDNDDKIFVYNVYETTYQNVFRYTECNFDAEKNYVFLGCSFMYGLGLEDNQILPYAFSGLLNNKVGVLNCGVPGKGSNTALNILQSNVIRKFIKQDSKIEKFIYLAMVGHPHRNFVNEFSNETSDNYVYENNKFVKVWQPFDFFTNTFARSYIFRKLFLNMIVNKNRIFYEDYFMNSLLKMNDIIEKKYNSKLTVLLWTDKKMGYGENFLEKLKNTNLDILILPEFGSEYYINNDNHPNEKANREIAELLLKHFEEQDKKYFEKKL